LYPQIYNITPLLSSTVQSKNSLCFSNMLHPFPEWWAIL